MNGSLETEAAKVTKLEDQFCGLYFRDAADDAKQLLADEFSRLAPGDLRDLSAQMGKMHADEQGKMKISDVFMPSSPIKTPTLELVQDDEHIVGIVVHGKSVSCDTYVKYHPAQ